MVGGSSGLLDGGGAAFGLCTVLAQGAISCRLLGVLGLLHWLRRPEVGLVCWVWHLVLARCWEGQVVPDPRILDLDVRVRHSLQLLVLDWRRARHAA